MRTKTVKRYYCEHCSKGMFKKPSMEAHELSCIRNPLRTCPVCQNRWDEGEAMKYVAILKKIETELEADVLKELSDECDHCPACILSAIVQFPQSEDPDEYHVFDFDYKKAKSEHDHEEMMTWGPGLGGTGFE